eukprot:scaffold10808_cov146-Isochrysis_galbana.AAC.1
MDGIEAALTGGGGGFDAGFGLVVPPLAGAVAAKPATCQRSPGPPLDVRSRRCPNGAAFDCAHVRRRTGTRSV